MLTPVSLIKSRLQSYPREYYDALTSELAALWNIDTASIYPGTPEKGCFPIWPTLDYQPKNSVEERPILDTCLKVLSRVLSNEPVPEFSGIGPVSAEVRQEFWLARARGDYDDSGGWFNHLRLTFLEGDALGCGCLQIGLVADRLSGEQKVTVKNIPIRQVVWDPNVANPVNSSWVAFCEYLSLDQAIEKYGDQHVRPHLTTVSGSRVGDDRQIVPVWSYFDLGSSKNEATYAVIIGQINKNPFLRKKNPFGFILPVSWMLGSIGPGYIRPVGRVAKMLSSQITLNRHLRRIDGIIGSGPGFTIISTQNIDSVQLDQIRRGVPNAVLEANGPIEGVPALRVPPSEPSQTELSLLQEYRNEVSRQGELSDMDRGSPLATTRSATELAYIQSGVEASQSSTVARTIEFLTETMEKVFKIAALYDRAPVTLNVKGYSFPVNDYREPASRIDKFLQEPAQLVLTSAALTGQDQRVQKAEKLSSIKELAPLVATGKVNADTFVTEYVKTVFGESEVERWLPKPEQTPVTQPSPDQMGQGQVPGNIPNLSSQPVEQQIGSLLKQSAA